MSRLKKTNAVRVLFYAVTVAHSALPLFCASATFGWPVFPAERKTPDRDREIAGMYAEHFGKGCPKSLSCMDV